MSARWGVITLAIALALAGLLLSVGQAPTHVVALEKSSADAGPVRVRGAARVQLAKTDDASDDIVEPDDPVEKKAFKALDRHCARCHQVGRLKREKPAKNFGNILKLEEIAGDPNLILPGNPDGSRLFSRIAKQEMPYDVYNEFSGGEEPSKDDVQAIYDWIGSLDKTATASCSDRKTIGAREIVEAILEDLNTTPSKRRRDMRYLTLTHFHNACASDDDMRRLRQGAVKFLNSLSRGSKVIQMDTVDPDKTVIALNLRDMNWSRDDWDDLLGYYPYGVQPKGANYGKVKSITNSDLPWLRADWFAFAASRPPIYYDLLDLPETFADLQSELGLDVGNNRDEGNVARAGFEKSGESRYNRMIERHALGDGHFWTTYDFDSNSTEQDLFKRPLGPGGKSGFKHELNQTIFSLPNGFYGYFVSDAEGERQKYAPLNIIADESRPNRPVSPGLSCFGCHSQGLRKATDEIRDHVTGIKGFPAETRDSVEKLYPKLEEMNQLFDADMERFNNAMIDAGLDPELEAKANGVESINYLAQQYEKGLDLRLAASEYGVTPARLSSGLAKAGKAAVRTKRELEQGLLSRSHFEPQFLRLAVSVSDDIPIDLSRYRDRVKKDDKEKKKTAKTETRKEPVKKTPRPKPAPTPTFTSQKIENELILISDKSVYRRNDLPVFTVQSNVDCYMTLINVDSKGDATVIFPNKFRQKNFLKANRDLQFPDDNAPFQFRLRDSGTETVIAECNSIPGDDRGIKHDFNKSAFTPLGDYREFVTQQAASEGKKKVNKGSTKPTVLARTAIKIKVR